MIFEKEAESYGFGRLEKAARDLARAKKEFARARDDFITAGTLDVPNNPVAGRVVREYIMLADAMSEDRR
ncbi:MAG: hypothetical protein MPK62_00540 [Alphaproteobacteria bacterium]|nr:hypothetical protein [Alphaproteobacteria bacterium]MDA8029626.1 hypothetical protein [Alphaproteobacteria bacterium]